MSIVLSILQIIGWILLAVLCLLLAVLLIVLFCPVHYLIEGEWLEEKWARFKVRWLLHLIRAKVSYGDDLIYGEVHIFWKKITFSFDLTKKEEAEDELENFDERVSDEESLDEALDRLFSDEVDSNDEVVLNEDDSCEFRESTDETLSSKEKVIGTETAAELRGEVVDAVENGTENASEDDAKENSENAEKSEEQKESIVSKIKGIIERIKEIYPKIKLIVADEKNHAAVKHIKDEVIYLIKMFLPKKSKIDAVFSTGSPDTTGQLFGVLACFPAMYNKDWKLLPDFEADGPYFKGTFWGRGKVSGYQFVGIVLRILFDKNCRRLYTMINKFLKWLKKDDKSQEEK